MTEFKIGDKVRRTTKNYRNVRVGEVYTIRQIYNPNTCYSNIGLDECTGSYGVEYFELVISGRSKEESMKMEIGKKYKGKITGRVFTCVGISTKGNSILEGETGQFVETCCPDNFEEYIEPRSGVVTAYVMMNKETGQVYATVRTESFTDKFVIVGQADINWVEKVD